MKGNQSYLAAMLAMACFFGAIAAQEPPYDKPPAVEPPLYRVRFEASSVPGELIFPVRYTVWIPEGVTSLRGVVVHQHGCGEGSCKSGLTGAFDLHWQALARKHDCALLAPSYEQPQKANCQMWCDPRNGSAEAFLRSLAELGEMSGHPELSEVPWALWGHSGGGHWVGGMTLLYPERVVATWLRSGVPLLRENPKRLTIRVHEFPEAALGVPMMCNPGTQEGVTVKTGRFAGVWPANESFFGEVRGKGGLIGVAVDPLSSHECGNQRYLAIPWLDACLKARLPAKPGGPLRPMDQENARLAPLLGKRAVPVAKYSGDEKTSVWLPNETVARMWEHYVRDTEIPDETPPPAPTGLKVKGNLLTWDCHADLESGLSHFEVFRDGEKIGGVPENRVNRFGRPIFQGLQYSDTPLDPLVEMVFVDDSEEPGQPHEYRVVSVNTVGLRSE